MDKVREVELEERKLLERLLSLQREKSLLRNYGDSLFRRRVIEANADLTASLTPVPESLGAPFGPPPPGEVSSTPDLFLSDVDWATIVLDPVLLADPGSAGGTTGVSPGNSSSQEVPTS